MELPWRDQLISRSAPLRRPTDLPTGQENLVSTEVGVGAPASQQMISPNEIPLWLQVSDSPD